ncbi:ATP-dependent helicase [Candidatus Pacearchaeota archaeon]|nr:ATP-dependent helicase [Candidatus Pacearchaeota archaeon]|tara:strand:- start:1322 stop:3907 length:2586 start_codon:yes stop_codon:yes gene_type:complete
MAEGKIAFIEKFDKKDVESILNPLVKEWFFGKFEAFSETQLYGVKTIHDRRNVLISAPTGGTKTLTAFLSILNYLVDLSLKNELEDKIYGVYISPLKALSNDIYVNLINPLEEIKELAEKKGLKMQDIRVGLRTGDTTPSERAKMARKAVHILVTTPESLAIILTTKKTVEQLAALEYLIVDEIHALTNKRGVYMSLTLERLVDTSLIEPVRVGLSATISPLEEIAKFLVGAGRDCDIADVKLDKGIEIGLDYPGESILEAETPESQEKLYKILDGLIEEHKTTLIFTNTRAATERMVHYLDLHFPGKYEGLIGAHHSSMSKDHRFMIEEKLRKGELKVVVSSTSLELGIDIGSIDLVVLLGSPKGVSRALQRIGRAGHKLHDKPKGNFLVLNRDDMVECGILMKNMVEKKIDEAHIPKNALDVLAQQIYGMAISRIWDVDDMLKTIRKSYCYSELKKNDFYDVVSYLAGDYALEHRHVYGKIWYDPETKQIGKKGKMARVLYMTNIGTIPEEGFISVTIQRPADRRGQIVGKIDESFLERMKRGDVFVLGGQKYQYLYSRGMKAYVVADVGKNVTIPSWFSEMLPLSFDVALDINKFRGLVKERLKDKKKCIEFIQEYIYCKKSTAKEFYNYFYEQGEFAEIPDDKTIVVEKVKEEKEYLIFHTLYGRRVNDALSRAYAYAAARLRHRDIEMGMNDNGFFIAGEKLDEKKILAWVKSKDLRTILKEAIEKTEVLQRRFRHCAARSLMILRNYKGREKSVGKQQVHSGFLLHAVKKISNEFPILREARREVFEDLMDVANAEKVLKWKESGKVKVKYISKPIVSPFGLSMMMQGRMDLIRMEDRANFLRRMHQLHLKAIGE